MNVPSEPNGAGFSERGQEPYGDVPTDPEAFLAWASLQRREAGRFELSNGAVQSRSLEEAVLDAYCSPRIGKPLGRRTEKVSC
jgi:hypothetical protein